MIDRDELAELAGLYDRYANGLDPLAPEWASARRRFFAVLDRLHHREGTGLSFETFRFEMVVRCKEYLRKN